MTSVEILDRTSMIDQLKAILEINPAGTAIVAIDMHRGHLDPEVATLPCSPEDSRRVVQNSQKFLNFARKQKIPVIHAILVYRMIPGIGSEGSVRPFFQHVRYQHQYLRSEHRSHRQQ